MRVKWKFYYGEFYETLVEENMTQKLIGTPVIDTQTYGILTP